MNLARTAFLFAAVLVTFSLLIDVAARKKDKHTSKALFAGLLWSVFYFLV